MRIALVAALTLTGVGTCATVSTAATAVPDGFLLYERAAIEGKGLWSINKQKGARLAINPCLNDKLGTKGRTAARTILYHRPPSDRRAEQVILYSSAKEASAALGELKNDLPRCPPFQSGPLVFRYFGQALRLGDEGLAVTGQLYDHGKAKVGGDRAVLTRRGNAVIVYARAGTFGAPKEADFAQQKKDAGTMLAKICRIANC